MKRKITFVIINIMPEIKGLRIRFNTINGAAIDYREEEEEVAPGQALRIMEQGLGSERAHVRFVGEDAVVFVLERNEAPAGMTASITSGGFLPVGEKGAVLSLRQALNLAQETGVAPIRIEERRLFLVREDRLPKRT